MSCNEPEFCKINVAFKEFKLNNVSFYFMTRPSPSSSSAGVATDTSKHEDKESKQ